jgi:hypothetical protein
VHAEGNQRPANTALTSSVFHIVLPEPDAEEQLVGRDLQAPLLIVNGWTSVPVVTVETITNL